MGSAIHFYLPAFNGGGAENAIIRLLNYWHALGRPVALIVNQDTGPLRHKLDAAIPVHALGSKHSLLNTGRLARHLRRHRPRLLVTALLSPNVAGVLAGGLSGRVCPVVCLVRNHTSTELAAKSRMRRALIKPLLTLAYRRADAIGCVAQDVADDLIDLFGVTPEKVGVTLNPVPVVRSTARPDDMPNDGAPVLLAIGRLVSQKDYPTVLRAVGKLQNVRKSHLVVLGDGEDRPILSRLVSDLGLQDRVHFLGYRNNPTDYMAHCDGFLLLSKFEGFPNVLAEALAAGASIVATDAPGGAADILDDGKYGKLVPVGDVEAAAYAMQQMLANPFDRDRQMARAQAFQIDRIAARYDRLFDQVCRLCDLDAEMAA
ncbi:glycosyltransferase [Pseudaestuariivita rosea]|uniref:glycosyltransferase n=1 Tax=Pseudaestuariivita rosea TaxID=2763263 RepID=UPI001ABBCE3C|nr:glycosyltransferase [Pseudaestuariivita rosea]